MSNDTLADLVQAARGLAHMQEHHGAMAETPTILRKCADEIEFLRAQNKVLDLKARNSLANNLCSDHRDKQHGKPCLACEIERLRSKAKLIISQSNRLLTATDCNCDWRYEQGRTSAAEDILAEEASK